MRDDLKLAWRMLRKTPALTMVAFVSLAVAIGLITAAFSVVQDAFLSPLPVPGGARLVMIHELHRGGRFNVPMTAAQFSARRNGTTTFAALGAWYSRNVAVGSGGADGRAATIVRAAYISPDSLIIVGIAPQRGRYPEARDVDSASDPVVVISDALWQSHFGGTSDILRQRIVLGGELHQIIGVMPPRYAFPIREDVWVPVQTDTAMPAATPETLTLFGKLRDGVSIAEATAELAVISAAEQDRDARNATTPLVMPFTRGFMSPEQVWAVYGFVAGLMAFLIVIAANLANLFLARNSARMREIAMRYALGATRSRLMAQLLMESGVLATLAAVAGTLLSRATLRVFLSQVPDLPWWADFSLNSTVIVFVACAAVVASVVAGIGPAIRLTRVDVSEQLKRSAAATALQFSRTGALLIAVQVAISVGFLSVVGVLAQGLFGFSYERYRLPNSEILVSQVYLGPPPEAELTQAGGNRRDVWQRHYVRSGEQLDRITERLRREPGVRSVTLSTHFPGNDVVATRIQMDTGSADASIVTTRIAEIDSEFFGTLNTPIELGRNFTAADRSGAASTVIVNAPFARKYFGGRSPLGTSIRIVGDDVNTPAGPWLQIIGVVPDLALNPGDPGRADGIYVPFAPSSFARIAVRSEIELARLIPLVHEIVTRENARAQLQASQSLAQQMQDAERVFRSLGIGLLVVGATALLLSAVSFYSLVAFGVTRRTREIGLRVALGAQRRSILHSVLARELAVATSGAIAGIALAFGLYQLVAMMPFDLRPAGPSILSVVIALLIGVGAGACLVPARRALAIAPIEALKDE